MKNRRFALGSYRFAFCLLALAGVILINLLLGALPASFTQWDLSAEKLYTLGDQTKTVVSSLKETVTVYLIAEGQSEDPTLLQLLKRYQELSEHLQVETVDPVVHPQFVSGYTELALNPNSLIVKSQKRHKVIDYTEIYEITSEEALEYYYTYGQYVPDTFSGESALTGAINYVTTETLPVVGVLSGHGEQSLSDQLIHVMENDNLVVRSTELLRTGIPENCSLLLINSPASDISSAEREMLTDFLSQGKRILLLTDVSGKDATFENLDALAKEFGFSRGVGAVVEEDPANYYLSPYYLFPQMESHATTELLMEAGYSVFLTKAHPIVPEEKEGITQTVLLQSSEKSYSETDPQNKDAVKSQEDPQGPHILGVLGENKTAGSALLWISSSSLANTSVDQMSSGANISLFLNALEWLCEKTDTLAIRSVSLSSDYLSLSSAQASLWTAVFCAVIPVSILATGAVIWWRRRSR